MDLVSLRIASANSLIRGAPASQSIAAGFTLLQRSAPLVRALAGRRSALLLSPASPSAALTALAASDGRGALLLDPSAPASSWPDQLKQANAGAVFTLQRHRAALATVPLPIILLDESPIAAQLIPAPSITAPSEPRRIDLGSHFGLDVTGTLDDPLREEEFVSFYRTGSTRLESLTHRALVDDARALEADPTAPDLIRSLILPALAGRAIG